MALTPTEALVVQATALRDHLDALIDRRGDYSDSTYDVLENLTTTFGEMLSAHYETDEYPRHEDAPWCPEQVISFLRQQHEPKE